MGVSKVDFSIGAICGGLVVWLVVLFVSELSEPHEIASTSIAETTQTEQVRIDCGETNLSSLWREAERYGEVDLVTLDMRPIGDLVYNVRVILDEDPIKVNASFKGKTPEEALRSVVKVLSDRFKVIGDQPKEQPNE